MAELNPTITTEIESFFKPGFDANPGDFVCVYGSSLYKGPETTSDVDLFYTSFGNGVSPELSVGNIATFIKDLHVRHGRKIDEEVPYENKVLYTDSELATAFKLEPFTMPDGSITIPRIEKNPEFLASSEIKARLALNALTTPHAVIAADNCRYVSAKEKAEEAVTTLAVGLCGQIEVGIGDLFQKLVVGPNGETGEMYLGYKTEYPVVGEYLMEVLDSGISRLVYAGVLKATLYGVVVTEKM